MKRFDAASANLQELRDRIDDEIPFIDVKPYSHNIIGLLLQQIAAKFGQEKANAAIDELGLDSLGWKVRKE